MSFLFDPMLYNLCSSNSLVKQMKCTYSVTILVRLLPLVYLPQNCKICGEKFTEHKMCLSPLSTASVRNNFRFYKC
jgi:hypothetical protein